MAVFRLKRWRKSSRTTCAAPLAMRGEVPPGGPESGRATLAIGGMKPLVLVATVGKSGMNNDILYFGMYWNVLECM